MLRERSALCFCCSRYLFDQRSGGTGASGGEDRDGAYGSDRRTFSERNLSGLFEIYGARGWDPHDKERDDPTAKELQLFTVLRVFVIDSMALKSIENLEHQHSGKPDFLEVMPGAMPKVLRKIKSISRIPLIAGGLIVDKEDVMGALLAGASAVSTSRQDVWEM